MNALFEYFKIFYATPQSPKLPIGLAPYPAGACPFILAASISATKLN